MHFRFLANKTTDSLLTLLNIYILFWVFKKKKQNHWVSNSVLREFEVFIIQKTSDLTSNIYHFVERFSLFKKKTCNSSEVQDICYFE